MNIILVRHTTVDVPEGMCYGQTNVPLTATFLDETKEIAQQLQNEVFDIIYSSPLTRCKKLAIEISNNQPITYDDRLLELYFGRWEGRYWHDINYEKESKAWFENWVDTPTPDGESFQQLMERVNQFLNQLKENHNHQDVLIVTHSGPIRAFISLLSNIEPKKAFDTKLDFGCILRFSI